MRIIDSTYYKSIYKINKLPEIKLPEFAFIGRSNVGKSSMINNLLNRKKLAQISKKPGKTRMINLFKIEYYDENNIRNKMYFSDLPGYGYANVSQKILKDWKDLIENYLVNRLNLCGIIIIVDIRHPLNEKDLLAIKFIKFLKKNFIIVATKSDKIKKVKAGYQIKQIKSSVFEVGNYKVLKYSSKNSQGKDLLLEWIKGKINKFNAER